MNKYSILIYNDNINIDNLDPNNLTRTFLFKIIFEKILKIIKILDNIDLLSESSQKNLEMYINIDIASKERLIIETLLRKEDYSKILIKLNNKESRVLKLFIDIIVFLDKNIKKLQNNENNYLDTITAETTISKFNTEKIFRLGEIKMNQINKILNKLKSIINLLQNKNVEENIIKNLNHDIKRITKLEKDIKDIQVKEKNIVDYDIHYEYHPTTITENKNGELSLSI
jgi:hypothetical protein